MDKKFVKTVLFNGDYYKITAIIYINKDKSQMPLKELEILSEKKVENGWAIDRSLFLKRDEALILARFIINFT